jgi:hypothetical protein
MNAIEIDEIRKCFNTLIWSGGSEAPAEAVWAANDFMKLFLNKDDIILLDEESSNWDDFIEQLNRVKVNYE